MGCIGGGGNNSDFQSKLLRMNGSLQSSITELRYHCEVYRLSLRSICKVLVSVQKEQDTRLRYLTTTRPSFHAYLLNLSQKQALERIRNVVRKASTFINGYSLVDKNLFQPPPPKPSTVRRTVSCDESKKTAPASNTSKLTDGLGRVSEGCSGGGNIGIGAVGILAVIAEEDEGEASANKKENDDAETASSKNNSRKVERKHHSKSRLRRGAEEGKKKSSGSSSKKSKSRSTKSKRTHGHSSASSEDGEIKKYGSNCDDESNDDDYNKRSRKEIKRRRKRENKKASSRSNSTSNRCDATATLDHADSPNSKQKDTERKKTLKQTRSQSITPTTARSHDNYRHHRHRHQVINSRTQANHEEAQLDDENVNKDASFAANVELNKRYHKQQGMLMSQSKSITNRIPSLFSISTSTSTVSSVVAMRRNKTSATSFLVSEKFTADARRGGGLGIRRPSSEKLLGRRVGSNNSNMKNTKCAVEKDCRSQNHSNRNISAICMKDRYESKITRAGTTARRWGNGTSTFTAFKAGYKVRESLAVVRNRNNDGNITAQQGQGGVGAAKRYLFSSQRPRNNFKLSSVCSSAIVTEKVRRIQVNGNYGRNSFCGGINEDKVFGATRKSVSSGSGNSHTNVGGGSGITTRHNAPS